MGNAIIGYYDYYYDKHEYSIVGSKGKIEDYEPSDIEKFFYKDNCCPFCKTPLKTVFLAFDSLTSTAELFYSSKLLECPFCKWWTFKSSFTDEYAMNSIHTDERYYGLIKRFNAKDKDLPIVALRSEFEKHPEILYDINPYKLEELSQHILNGIYDCEVVHVGKTGDGGKDLLILNSDSPIIVQVKRRSKPGHIELVKGVRELVGTLYIDGYKKGMYITTAKDFSRGAKKVANQLLNERKFDFFELINYDRLCSLINDVPCEDPWTSIVTPLYSRNGIKIYDNEESISKYNKSIRALREELEKNDIGKNI